MRALRLGLPIALVEDQQVQGTAGMAEQTPRRRLLQDSAWRHDLQLRLPGLVASGVQEALRTLAPRVELLELRFDRLDAIVDGISNSHEFDIALDGDQQMKMAALAVGNLQANTLPPSATEPATALGHIEVGMVARLTSETRLQPLKSLHSRATICCMPCRSSQSMLTRPCFLSCTEDGSGSAAHHPQTDQRSCQLSASYGSSTILASSCRWGLGWKLRQNRCKSQQTGLDFDVAASCGCA